MKDLKGMYSFWKTLRSIGRSPNWKKKNKNGRIRLVDKDGHEYCPLTAVCQKKTGEFYEIDNAGIAGDNLNISMTNQNRIIESADNDLDYYFDKKTRNKLLKTLRLKETK